jgi:hypothetical protein
MSHFSLAVIIPERIYNDINLFDENGLEQAELITNEYLEKVMAPYEEDCDVEYLEPEDETADVLDSYLDSSVKKIRMPDGSLLNCEVGEGTVLRAPTEDELGSDRYHGVKDNLDYILSVRYSPNETLVEVPKDNGELVKLPLRNYMSFYEYANENCYDNVQIVYDNNEAQYGDGSVTFRIFGDESELLKVWPENVTDDEIRNALNNKFSYTVYRNPHPKWDYWGVISSEESGDQGPIPTKDGKWVSACQIKDLSLTLPISDEKKQYLCRLWEVAMGAEQTKEEKKNHTFLLMYRPEYYQKFYGTCENFIKKKMMFSSYAILTEEHGWVEPGQMGWFAMSDETPESRAEYEDKFLEIIKNSNPHDVIVMLDCHI